MDIMKEDIISRELIVKPELDITYMGMIVKDITAMDIM